MPLLSKLEVNSNGDFIDEKGNKIILKGINLDASSKFPFKPCLVSSYPSDRDDFWNGEDVSFVGRPFPLSEAKEHFTRIKSWGYNCVRYIFTWEAIEHSGPGIYDEDFVKFTGDILQVLYEVGGIYVFLDIHQDVWSRFTGGSGAPLWTYYAAGFNPKNFKDTGAAILHGDYYKDLKAYPKMLWPSNYYKLAAGTMFTIFYSGNLLFPKLKLNGVSLQDYLVDHYMNALKHLVVTIGQQKPHLFTSGMLFGIEMLNEPNKGFLGSKNFTKLDPNIKMRLGPTPTFYQSLKLSQGIPCEVEEYQITLAGPARCGSIVIDPKGSKVWLSKEECHSIDSKYGFVNRSWNTESCIYDLHGLWNHQTFEILNADFFVKHPTHESKVLNLEYFTNCILVDHFVKFKTIMRDSVRSLINDEFFILLQPLVLQKPPDLKNIEGGKHVDKRLIYAPHYYDGLSLMKKHWSNFYAVDTLGIIRGKYCNPIFSISFGESRIKKSFKEQFKWIKEEGQELLGKSVPIIMTETGMPFDMDDKKLYSTGDYSMQESALDTISVALEANDISHTYWTYCSTNSHKFGDDWNFEDFSFWSKEPKRDNKELTCDDSVTTVEEVDAEEEDDDKRKLYGDYNDNYESLKLDKGTRAANATIRPFVKQVYGQNISSKFEMKLKTFRLIIEDAKNCFSNDNNEQLHNFTLIFLPLRHFLDFRVKLYTSGDYKLDGRYLKWYHGDGYQEIKIVGINLDEDKADEDEYSGIFGICAL